MNPRQQIEHNLTNHPPTSDQVVGKFESIRAAAIGLGHMVAELCPDSREKSLALTKLEETVMWAVASIARNQGE